MTDSSSATHIRSAAASAPDKGPRRAPRIPLAKRLGRILIAIWLPALLLLAWGVASAGSTNSFFPPLTEILDTLRVDFLSSAFSTNLLPSLIDLVLGFLLGLVIALAVGYAVGLTKTARGMLMPILDVFRSTPVVALIPVFIALFGIGWTSTVPLIAWTAFWPIVIGTIAGVSSVDTGFRDTATALRMNWFQKVWMVRLPAAAPHIFAGVNVAVAISVSAMVAIGLFSATPGLGRYLVLSKIGSNMSDAYAGAIAAGLVGFGAALLFYVLERRVFMRWHFKRGEVNGDN